jgi:hypothetical protein
MFRKLQDWWKAGEEDAVTVYRARLLVPLMILTAIVVVGYLVTSPDVDPARHEFTGIWFSAVFWCALMIPLFLRRRRAVIFTPNVFLFRPACGAILRVPISGVKRASPIQYGANEEYPIPTVHIELLVGGSVDVRLGGLPADEIIKRLNACRNLS